MADSDERKTEGSEPRRSREQLLRDIKLALAFDGLGLDEPQRKSRGFDPYDTGMRRGPADHWKGRGRG